MCSSTDILLAGLDGRLVICHVIPVGTAFYPFRERLIIYEVDPCWLWLSLEASKFPARALVGRPCSLAYPRWARPPQEVTEFLFFGRRRRSHVLIEFGGFRFGDVSVDQLRDGQHSSPPARRVDGQ